MRAAGEIFIIFFAKRLEYGLLRGGRRIFWWGGGGVGANSEKLGGVRTPKPPPLYTPLHVVPGVGPPTFTLGEH